MSYYCNDSIVDTVRLGLSINNHAIQYTKYTVLLRVSLFRLHSKDGLKSLEMQQISELVTRYVLVFKFIIIFNFSILF